MEQSSFRAMVEFFTNTRKGELAEFRKQLQSPRNEVRAGAMKKILIAIIRGVDVDRLFPDVLQSAQTDCLKLKKLVFMYLTVTAQRQPDMAMLAVNTLTRDLGSDLPLVRALALRTVAGMGVEHLIRHVIEPLQQCLSDEDPYVRKTAALCVARLHLKQRQWVEDVGLADRVKEMLSDANVAVVVNVVAALMDMGKFEQIEFSVLNKIMTALSSSHEWGQVAILEAVSKYEPKTPWEVRALCERVTPFLAHSNAAVVLTAVKVLLTFADLLPGEEAKTNFINKLASPLKTLLSSEPAIQYVTLRNIQIILQKYPRLIGREVRIFYIKYNDPIYVKMEKLEVIVQLAEMENIGEVLSELREYVGEADVELVRSSVQAIGRCALKHEAMADRCVKTLINLVETDVVYVIESAIIAFRDIFRRYPRRYEQAINTLSGRLERIDDSEARAAFIWMLGEYSARLTDVENLLESFIENFQEETTAVQLATLTATVKAFLEHPSMSNTVHTVLKQAVQATNVDLRDRAFIYWRLLSTDPGAAKAVVLAEKPPIGAITGLLAPNLLDVLIREIGTLASVYHKEPSEFQTDKEINSDENNMKYQEELFFM